MSDFEEAPEARALMISLQRGSNQVLAFDEDIEEVSIMDLRGRSLLRRSKQGGPIVITVQGQSSQRLAWESGLWLIRMRDSAGTQSIQPFIVVK